MRTARLAAALLLSTIVAAGPACAQAQWVPGHWDWAGARPGDASLYALQGPGMGVLLPELRDSRRGRAFVARNFDWDRNGFITVREARAANRAFLAAGGPAEGRFDWAAVDRGPPPPPGGYAPPPPGQPGAGWDRDAMRAYAFRDTPEGARFTLQEDVLFRTDSADLRPGAVGKLDALARYLRANPGVRVGIDGFTDARGSDAYNLDLSARRAASVRQAFASMGLVRDRFSVRGHGEADPIAPNTTPDGMRRNRRVEITLLGQRARDLG